MTRTTSCFLLCLAFVCLTLIIPGSGVLSQSLEPFTVRIDRLNLSAPREEISVDVTLQAGWANMSGFDFLIAYENGPLRIHSISPGDLAGSCDWEYFAWRVGSKGPRDEYNRTTDTIRVSAAAGLSLGYAPACYNLEPKPITLFTLTFHSAGPQAACTYSPIRFYWRSCYDNRISVPASVMPMPHDEVETIAQRVFEPTGWEITRSDSRLPGWFGPPSGCISMAENSPVPYVNLVNGGVTFAAGCQQHSRGDINLNGTPYEIEDSWIFAKYLLFGDTTLRRGASLDATDMNLDGRPGTVEDLVLLMRAVLGEYAPAALIVLDTPSVKNNPFVPPAPKPSRVHLSVNDNELLLATTDTLVAARFVFSGRINPHLYNRRLDLYQAYVDGETRLLIYGFFTDATFSDGPLLYWEGSGRLKDAAFATPGGGRVDVRIGR